LKNGEAWSRTTDYPVMSPDWVSQVT
jgi:hypothetical protein